MELRLLALMCLVGAAFAGPFQRETGSRCSKHCPKKSHHNFNYEVGKKYVYTYQGENYVTIAGNRKQKASIEGIAEFHFVTKCEGVLKVKNVRLQQKLSSSELFELVRDLQKPVSFAYVDGAIEHVCPQHDDSRHSLNIKKGILSTIINTMTNLHTPQEVKEYDSLGKCATKYTVESTDGLLIRKVKDLKSCTNRHNSVTSLITSPYDASNARINTLPIFPDEHLVCEQTIKDEIIQRVKCTEHSRIKPMKSRDSMIQFDGEIELSLLSKDVSKIEQLEHSNGPESILYNLEEQKDARTLDREAEELLRDICSKNNGVMDISVSKDFIKLISKVKTMSYSSLDQIQKSLKNGALCKSKKVWDLFVDTLPMAGSNDAIKLLVHLIVKKEITDLKAKLWPASLAFIPKPNRETISNIMPLLSMGESAPAPVLLGVSAMLHRFCSSEDCSTVPEVRTIIEGLSKPLVSSKWHENEDKVLAVLKAFGNIGYLGEARQKIIALAKDQSKTLRLRLAAVDAFRRVLERRPDEILRLFEDTEENYELRIVSLASVMKHADNEQLERIKVAIENESDDQVLGYAVSYIKNMNTTSSPLKRHVKKLLQNIEVSPSRKVSYWDHSKNLEFSVHSEALNAGVTAEGNIIHQEGTKVPRSTSAKLDVELFGQSMNILETGLRAEGIVELIEKLIGMKNKIPKIPKWDDRVKDMWRQSNADISFFMRTMGVEVLDYSAHDLTTLGEVVKIAELMRKLSHERKADFSHSFLFLNSELVIPSVTGRSYTLGLTGSATVALTASTKLNLLGFPRSADAHIHFQPSANIEVSTTVGIQSNKHRPDIKLVSRMHVESNVEAKGHIKDGHIATVSVSLPSENVMFTKFSTDVVEIDADHNEKRVFDKMQTKIDYCYNKLERPLGLSFCGKWNVAQPFVSKTFPYLSGVGEVELSIKKTDSSFTSYEATVEIPRHHGHHMRYQASLDTPGSKVNRRFAAELDVNQKSRGHSDLKLEVTSPFKSAGGSGSLTRRSDLWSGSIELHSGSRSLLAINASTSIADSRSKVIYKPRIYASVLNYHPLDIQGSVSIIKGRKQQITIDLKSNKPRSKPITIMGTILKEGRFGLSRKSEWKVSSDVRVQSPLVDVRLRKTLEKKGDAINKLSTSLSVDYQIRDMKKESVKLSGLVQQSSSKINANLRLESTEFPVVNVDARFDRQGESGKYSKNDVSIKYGLNPEKTYITLNHHSEIPDTGLKKTKISVKAPDFDIDSDVVFKHSVETGDKPKVHFEVDARVLEDQHVKGLVSFNYESRSPLKATTRAEIEYPGGKISYRDEIEEVEKDHLKGKTRVEWGETKHVELEYRYQKFEDHHYELEGSLRTSSLPRPIMSKLTYRLDDKSLNVQGQLSDQRDQKYVLEALLSRMGHSRVVLKAPQAEGHVKVRNEGEKKSVEWGLNLKTLLRKPRHITGAASMDLEKGKKFQVELVTDARNPSNKIFAATELVTAVDTFTSKIDVQVYDHVSLSISESGDVSWLGKYKTIVKASVKNHQPIEIQYEHNLSQKHAKSILTISRKSVRKAQIEIEGGFNENGNEKEISARAALKSLDNSFESKEVSMSHQLTKSGSSAQLKSLMRYQHSPTEIFEAHWDSGLQPNGLELKAEVNTPHEDYKKQSVGLTLQRSDRAVSSSVRIQMPNNRVISLRADAQAKNNGVSLTWDAKTPFDIIRNVKVHVAVENEVEIKKISSYIDVNSARIADIEGSLVTSKELELKGQMKIAPVPNVSFQGVSFTLKKSISLQMLSGRVDLANSKHISVESEIKEDGEKITATASYSTSLTKVKNGKFLLSVSNANQSIKKNILLQIYADSSRIAYIEATIVRENGLELTGQMDIAPVPNVNFRGISFAVRNSKSLHSFSGKVDLDDKRQISVNTEIKEEGKSISAVASYSTPFSQVKDGKAFLSVSNQEQQSERSLLFYVDSNGERKGDIEFGVTCSEETVELQGRMKTSITPEVSGHLKVENVGESYSVSGKVLKGTSPLWSAVVSKQKLENGDELIVKSESFEKTMLDLQVSNEVSEDHIKLRVKASGRFSPVSLSVSARKSEKNAVRMEIRACQATSTSSCYILKAYHKNMKNSENYRIYRNLTFELEKSNGDTNTERVGSAHLLLSSTDQDYRSKVVLEYLKKNIGYEIRIHRRHHDNEPCTMELSVMRPDRTSRVKGSILHSTNSMLLEVESVPNVATPERKCSLEMKREISPRSNEVSGHIKILGIDMKKPILLKGKLETRGLLPVRGKVELHYSRTSWYKVLILEIVSEKQRSGKESVLYRLYREDESTDVSVRLSRQNSRDEDMFGLDWKYKCNNVEKEGGCSMTLSRTRSGKPETLQISYYAPNADLKIQGSNTPSESSVKVLSGGRVIKEIRILSKESCLYFDVNRSGPFFKSSVCINKHDGKSLQLVSIDATFRQRKCLDVRVGVDPTSPSFLDVNLEWKREDLITALSELTGLKSLLNGRTLRQLEHDLRKHVHRVVERLEHRFRDVKKHWEQLWERIHHHWRHTLSSHGKMLKEHIEKMEELKDSIVSFIWHLIPWDYIGKQVLGPLRGTIKCLIDGYTRLVTSHIPDFTKFIWNITQKQFEHCLKKFCKPGSFCHNFVKSYESHGFRPVRDLIQKRIDETRRNLKDSLIKFWIPKFLSPWRLIRVGFKVAIRMVKLAIRLLIKQILAPVLVPYKIISNIVKLVNTILEELFGKFLARIIMQRIKDLGHKLEEMVRKRAQDLVDYIIHKVRDWIIHAEKDEDFRTAMALVKDAKRKALLTWRDRAELLRKFLEPLERNVSDNIKKTINERFELLKYNPTEGLIRFRVKNILGPAQMELLKNLIREYRQRFNL